MEASKEGESPHKSIPHQTHRPNPTSQQTMMALYENMNFKTGCSYPPTDEEIARLREVERVDVHPWRDSDIRGRVMEAGQTVWTGF